MQRGYFFLKERSVEALRIIYKHYHRINYYILNTNIVTTLMHRGQKYAIKMIENLGSNYTEYIII